MALKIEKGGWLVIGLIGVALVGNDSHLLEARLQQIMKFIENQHQAEIIDSQVELCYLEK